MSTSSESVASLETVTMFVCVCLIRRWLRLCLSGRRCCCLHWGRGWSSFTHCCLRALTDGRVSPKDRYLTLPTEIWMFVIYEPKKTKSKTKQNKKACKEQCRDSSGSCDWMHNVEHKLFKLSFPFRDVSFLFCDNQWSHRMLILSNYSQHFHIQFYSERTLSFLYQAHLN